MDVRIAETISAFQGYWEELDWSHFYKHNQSLGGESPQDIQDRMIDFWEEIKDQVKGDVIICSHGDPLYLLYARLIGLPTPDIKSIFDVPEEEYQSKGSIRPVIYDNGKISISSLMKAKDL